ncbi:MAG: hypothetical protein QJR13_05040 [Bacillota bacterium]|nr:hypothetical protein [Bacillota bacterium]
MKTGVRGREGLKWQLWGFCLLLVLWWEAGWAKTAWAESEFPEVPLYPQAQVLQDLKAVVNLVPRRVTVLLTPDETKAVKRFVLKAMESKGWRYIPLPLPEALRSSAHLLSEEVFLYMGFRNKDCLCTITAFPDAERRGTYIYIEVQRLGGERKKVSLQEVRAKLSGAIIYPGVSELVLIEDVTAEPNGKHYTVLYETEARGEEVLAYYRTKLAEQRWQMVALPADLAGSGEGGALLFMRGEEEVLVSAEERAGKTSVLLLWRDLRVRTEPSPWLN